jgi:hypothetical protein
MAAVNGDATLDIIARTPEVSVSVGGIVRGDSDVELRGILSDPQNYLANQLVILALSRQDLDGAFFERGEDELTLFDEGTGRLDTIASYSASTALDGRYEIHAGIVASEEGRDVDVVAVADPVPIVIVGAGLLAAACMVGGGISWLVEWIQTQSSGQAEACRARGGFPKVVLEFSWSFRLRRHEFGCTVRPRFRCEDSAGRVLYEDVGQAEPVHALAGGTS